MTDSDDTTFDTIIVGAGPGGLQAAIHLARYNFRVLLFDGGPGRTRVRLADGTVIPCEVVLGGHGYRLSDGYLSDLLLERSSPRGSFRTNGDGESSLHGLFIVGSLRDGHSPAVISAGQGAVAALEIANRLVSL